MSSPLYNTTTGAYTGTATTSGVLGEWVQLQFPEPFVASQFTLLSDSVGVTVFGSSDGSTWVPIYNSSNIRTAC